MILLSKQIKSMCMTPRFLKSLFERNPLIQNKYSHHYRRFIKIVEPNIDKLIDSNVRYCKVWKGILFAFLDAKGRFQK